MLKHDAVAVEAIEIPAPDPDTFPAGDARLHLEREALVAGLSALRPPRRRGRLVRLVARGADHTRMTPQHVELAPGAAMPGDRWAPSEKYGDGKQITIMRHDVAKLFANGQDTALAGDNFMVDLDLSDEALPVGSRLRVGSCELEITAVPHNGCKRFTQRFGVAAMKLTAEPAWRGAHLRGVHARVVRAGRVSVGDAIEVEVGVRY